MCLYLCVCVCVCVCACVHLPESTGREWTPKSHYWSVLPPRHTLGSRAAKWPLRWFTLNPLLPPPAPSSPPLFPPLLVLIHALPFFSSTNLCLLAANLHREPSDYSCLNVFLGGLLVFLDLARVLSCRRVRFGKESVEMSANCSLTRVIWL